MFLNDIEDGDKVVIGPEPAELKIASENISEVYYLAWKRDAIDAGKQRWEHCSCMELKPLPTASVEAKRWRQFKIGTSWVLVDGAFFLR